MNSRPLPVPPYNPGVKGLVEGKRAGSQTLSPETVQQGFQGWHERGYLPHRDEPGKVQFVTFRLADAFPETLSSEWQPLLEIQNTRQRKIEWEAYLDKGRGACLLRHAEIARLVEKSFLCRHGEDYELRAWVIMPNHVHLLFKVLGVPMSQVVGNWKGFTAKQANKLLGRQGKFWQSEYWDTFIRDEEHERRTRKYIEENPAKAGLAATRQDWPWGSARFRDAYDRLCLPA